MKHGSTYYQRIIHKDSVTDFIMEIKAYGGRIADSHRIGFSDYLLAGYKMPIKQALK